MYVCLTLFLLRPIFFFFHFNKYRTEEIALIIITKSYGDVILKADGDIMVLHVERIGCLLREIESRTILDGTKVSLSSRLASLLLEFAYGARVEL